jgi:hypothetical protein
VDCRALYLSQKIKLFIITAVRITYPTYIAFISQKLVIFIVTTVRTSDHTT